MEIDDGVVREFEEGMERELEDTTHRGTVPAARERTILFSPPPFYMA